MDLQVFAKKLLIDPQIIPQSFRDFSAHAGTAVIRAYLLLVGANTMPQLAVHKTNRYCA